MQKTIKQNLNTRLLSLIIGMLLVCYGNTAMALKICDRTTATRNSENMPCFIPTLMRNKGWSLGAEFLDHWFDGRDWLLIDRDLIIDIDKFKTTDKDARLEIDKLRRSSENNNIMTKSHWTELIKQLKGISNGAGGYVYPDGGKFNFIDEELKNKGAVFETAKEAIEHEKQDMRWFYEIKLGSSYVVSGLAPTASTAAFGDFVLRLVADGEVVVDNIGLEIKVSKIGAYFRDSFDFTGFQPLGCWSYSSPYINSSVDGCSLISNSSFRENYIGKDFRIFSKIYKLSTNEYKYTFDSLPRTNEQNLAINWFHDQYIGYFGSKLGANYPCYNDFVCQTFSTGKIIAVKDGGLSWYDGNNWNSFGYMK